MHPTVYMQYGNEVGAFRCQAEGVLGKAARWLLHVVGIGRNGNRLCRYIFMEICVYLYLKQHCFSMCILFAFIGTLHL
jgi:TRAP-type mannitol/chloroaromatic compound transport system permease small subunit